MKIQYKTKRTQEMFKKLKIKGYRKVDFPGPANQTKTILLCAYRDIHSTCRLYAKPFKLSIFTHEGVLSVSIIQTHTQNTHKTFHCVYKSLLSVFIRGTAF